MLTLRLINAIEVFIVSLYIRTIVLNLILYSLLFAIYKVTISVSSNVKVPSSLSL